MNELLKVQTPKERRRRRRGDVIIEELKRKRDGSLKLNRVVGSMSTCHN